MSEGCRLGAIPASVAERPWLDDSVAAAADTIREVRMSDEPTARLELRITPDLWNAIDRLAKEEGRHITSQARLLIERGLMATASRPRPSAMQMPIAQRLGLDKPRKRPR